MHDAIALHIHGLMEDGLPIPKATTKVETIRVAA